MNFSLIFQALTHSIGNIMIHGWISPSLLLWSSTEIRKAFRGWATNLVAVLTMDKNQKGEEISERGRALVRAKQATEWRRQQRAHPISVSASEQPQASSLRIIQEILENHGRNGRVEAETSGTHVPVTPLPIIQPVRSRRTAEHESGVLLRCGNLQLMAKTNDPVYLIKSFKTSR